MMKQQLLVTIVGPLPPPMGGMANQTAQLQSMLGSAGLSTTLVQTNAAYQPRWAARIKGIRALFRLVPYLYRLWTGSTPGGIVHVMANSGWAWFLFAAPAIAIARLRGAAVLVNYRGGLAEAFLAKHHGRVVPRLRQAAVVVVPSRFLQEVFARYGVDSKVIPNVVDTTIFTPRTNKLGHSARPHLVIARNLEALYGIDLAIAAMPELLRRYPATRLSIAGTGPERRRLREQAALLGLGTAVRFTGQLTPVEMARLYADADLLLNPTRADNMPNSLLEAMACGLPIITTNVGGISYMVAHSHTAWFMAAHTADALVSAVARVWDDRELQAALIANGLALARANSQQTVLASWLETYHSMQAPRGQNTQCGIRT